MTSTNAQTNGGLLGTTPALPSDLKLQNRVRILQVFRDGKDYTAGDISAATGVSKLTVMRAIQFFCGKGILHSLGKGDSTDVGGKKPEYFQFSFHKYLLHITMWPGNLNFTLFNMGCTVVGRSAYSCILPSTMEETFALIERRVNDLLLSCNLQKSQLYGVSLSTAGTVDYKNNLLKYSSRNPEWGADIPIHTYLEGIFGSDVFYFVENAGKSTGRSVLRSHDTSNKRVLVLFTTWGLSACLIQNGVILNGKDSLIGEIGHMTLEPSDPERCGCGCYGCFERLIDVSRLRKRIAADPPPPGSVLAEAVPEAVSLNLLFAASRQADAYARKQVDYLADKFALVLRNISLVFNPDLVVFLGDYALADDYFDQRLKKQISSFRYFPQRGAFCTQYDDHSLLELDAMGGAIALAENFFAEPSLYAD